MTYPENTASVDDMLNMQTVDLAQMPVELLAGLQAELAHATKQLRMATARFNTALEVRYATRAAEAHRACGKDTGTVRLADGDYTVVADLPKRVDWDQEKLAAMVARIRAAGDDPAEYVDLVYKVPERKYTALPESWRKGFEPARTVRTGKPKFRFDLNGGAA